MPDSILTPTHALESAPTGHFGTVGDATLTMTAPKEGAVLMLLSSGTGDVSGILRDHGDFDVRDNGPGQYLAIRDTPLTDAELSDITRELDKTVDVVDQSAARARIVIEGESVRDFLSKGVPVDLHLDQFEINKSATTLCGHIGIHLTRTGDNRFELIVTRSYAVALWESLIEMGLEYGIDCHHL